MVQKIFPFLHSPLEAPEFLNIFKGTMRNGVVRASEIIPGSTGWKLTVKAGEIIVDGSWVYDDADKIDGLDLAHIAGADRHYVVYESYAYSATDPAPTAQFGISAAATPPNQPTIPAGAVKLSDIFVPAAAASIGTYAGLQTDPVQLTTTGVRIVMAPRLWPRDDTGELMDRLVMAASNTMIFTDGDFVYNDDVGAGVGKLFISQPVKVQSLCTTYRQSFQGAPPIIRSTIPAAPSPTGLTVPGTAGARDIIIYTMIDRSSPTDSAVGTIKFMNRVNPGSAEILELLDYTKRTQVVILGVIVGSKMSVPGVLNSLPLADADNDKFLRNNSSGAHTWNLLDDNLLVGGHRTVADTTARDAIAAKFRKQGMTVYCTADDTTYALIGGTANVNWAPLQADTRLFGGFRCIDWTASAGNNEASLDTFIKAQIPSAKRKVGMRVVVRETASSLLAERIWDGTNFVFYKPPTASFGIVSGCAVTNPSANTVRIAAGQFYTPLGKLITIPVDTDVTVSATNRTVHWDDSAGIITTSGVTTGVPIEDFPFAFASFNGSALTRFIDYSVKQCSGTRQDGILIGNSATLCHSTRHDLAAMWLAAFDDDALPGLPRILRIIDDVSLPSLTSLTGTADFTAGVGTGTGTRWLRDLAVGDLVRVSAANFVVASIASDTSMTLTAGPTGSGLTVQRCDHASSYAPAIDTTRVEFSSSGSLTSLMIDGMMFGDNLNHSTISWGNNVYTNTKPCLSFGTTSGTESVLLRNLKFLNAGLRDASVVDNSWLKCPGRGLIVDTVEVDCRNGGTSGLTSIVQFLDQGLTEFTDTFLFNRFTVTDHNDDNTANVTSVFSMGPSAGGNVRVTSSSFSSVSADFYDFVVHTTASNTNMNWLFDDCDFREIDVAIFGDNTGGTRGSDVLDRVIRNSRFHPNRSGASTWLIGVDPASTGTAYKMVHVINCTLTTNARVNFQGAATVRDCTARAGTQIVGQGIGNYASNNFDAATFTAGQEIMQNDMGAVALLHKPVTAAGFQGRSIVNAVIDTGTDGLLVDRVVTGSSKVGEWRRYVYNRTLAASGTVSVVKVTVADVSKTLVFKYCMAYHDGGGNVAAYVDGTSLVNIVGSGTDRAVFPSAHKRGLTIDATAGDDVVDGAANPSVTITTSDLGATKEVFLNTGPLNNPANTGVTGRIVGYVDVLICEE